jgi:UDP-N-acetylmuramoyl-L-alanyl-D-glutamate--2,6-diaminopimelate ligase
MAAAVTKASDLTVLTSDNPRTEDPAAILADIRAGVVAGAEVIEIIDRPEAIAYAIRAARPEDVVVLAGKGHENYQIIGCQKHPMDDRELAREALAAR